MRMKVSYKILAGYLAVLILLAVVAFLGINGMKTGQKDFSTLIEKRLALSSNIEEMRYRIVSQGFNFRGYMLTKSDTWYQKFLDDGKKAKELKGAIEPMLTTEEGKVHLSNMGDLQNQYENLAEQVRTLMTTGRDNEVGPLSTQAGKVFEELDKVANDFIALNEKASQNEIVVVEQKASTSQNVSLIISVVAAIVAIGIGLYISASISKPVIQVANMLKDMAESGGDLTKRIAVTVKDEVGDLAHWFNAFLDNLHDIMAQVKQSSETVSAAANETSLGNQDLSQRTEEQASSLEEISSTIEEISASLQKSSENSGDADKISRTTLNTVRSSEQVVNEMQAAMEEITKGSHAIAEIIAKVNDIAFQTNLLALNTAVEAARAGEQGRGFAVVAAEVRNLAGRTAESAKEIEGLIKDSINRVDKGNQLMDGVSKVLGDVVTNTEHATEVIMEIAASMKEQSAAAEDIRVAVEQLNQVTQQNASLVEEIAGSSESVSNEAEDLSSLVGKFKLNEMAKSLQNSVNSHKIGHGSTIHKPSIGKKVASAGQTKELSINEADFEKF